MRGTDACGHVHTCSCIEYARHNRQVGPCDVENTIKTARSKSTFTLRSQKAQKCATTLCTVTINQQTNRPRLITITFLHCSHSMRQDICNGMVSFCLFVRLSAPDIDRYIEQHAAGLLLWVRRVGDIDRLLHGRRPAATAPQQQRRAVSRFQPPYKAGHRLLCSLWLVPITAICQKCPCRQLTQHLSRFLFPAYTLYMPAANVGYTYLSVAEFFVCRQRAWLKKISKQCLETEAFLYAPLASGNYSCRAVVNDKVAESECFRMPAGCLLEAN